MKIVYFTHSLASCWNHGNAHFLRGVASELVHRGHRVDVYEPRGSWSLANLLDDHGRNGLEPWRRAYPELSSRTHDRDFDIEAALAGADLVLVHEWNEPTLVARVGRHRRDGGRYRLLFHDTHHRAVSDPDAMRAYDLSDYDGVLAFGAALAEVYRRWGWGDRAFVWHEAADTRRFRPPRIEGEREGIVFIGNWGDNERSTELETFLLGPVQDAGLDLDIYGVRYPQAALDTLARYGARYRGWMPNASVPDVFAQHMATVHVPRRYYADALPGIPTIRVFEALACGIPLVSAPWDDTENLFRPGTDYLLARSREEAAEHLRRLAAEPEYRHALADAGLETIRSRHTCAHRVDELLAILDRLDGAPAARLGADPLTDDIRPAVSGTEIPA